MKLTAEQFKAKVAENPRWCESLTEPCEVTEFVDLSESGIECLSPHLTFSGMDDRGASIDLTGCRRLDTIQGTFNGGIHARRSGVRAVSQVNVRIGDRRGIALDISESDNLETISGNFAGALWAAKSSVQDIARANITGMSRNASFFDEPRFPFDNSGISLNVSGCSRLTEITGIFPGAVFASNSGVKHVEVSSKRPSGSTALSLAGCPNLESVSGNFDGNVDVRGSSIQRVGTILLDRGRILVDDCENLKKVPLYLFRSGAVAAEAPHYAKLKLMAEIAATAPLKPDPSLQFTMSEPTHPLRPRIPIPIMGRSSAQPAQKEDSDFR